MVRLTDAISLIVHYTTSATIVHILGLLSAQLKPAAEYNKYLRAQWALLDHHEPSQRIDYKQFLDRIIQYKYIDKQISTDDYCVHSHDPENECSISI